MKFKSPVEIALSLFVILLFLWCVILPLFLPDPLNYSKQNETPYFQEITVVKTHYFQYGSGASCIILDNAENSYYVDLFSNCLKLENSKAFIHLSQRTGMIDDVLIIKEIPEV